MTQFVDLLENWEKHYPNLPKPKALYTIATGQNPTGFTQSLEFRKKFMIWLSNMILPLLKMILMVI